MLIVFSGNTSWSMYNFRLGVMKKFVELGYRVCVVAPEDDYTPLIKQEGIEFISVKNLKRSGTNPIEDYLLMREYTRIYKRLKPFLIFHYTIKPNIYGTIAAKACNIPSISVTTGLGNAFAKKGPVFYLAKYLYKYSSVHAREVWFLNSNDCMVFIENRIIPADKSFILPGEGVDVSLFAPAPSCVETSATTFLLASRMLYSKGVGVFVEASKILLERGYTFSSLLLGQIDMDNPERIPIETIKKWQQAGLIKYLGATSDVRSYMQNADCVVLPSFYKEGIPRSLLEAASMEKPIITTRNPGCEDVVDDGVNGYLCDINDVYGIANSMEKFIHLSSAEKINMGKAGRKKVEANFDEKVIIGIYLSKVKQNAVHTISSNMLKRASIL